MPHKHFDFEGAFKRLSTWAGWAAGLVAAVFTAYTLLPPDAQAEVPRLLLKVMGLLGMVCGGLTFVATSYRQKNLRKEADDA